MNYLEILYGQECLREYELIEKDFDKAIENRNFVKMEEFYDELVNYDFYARINRKIRYSYFTELKDGNTIELPREAPKFIDFSKQYLYVLFTNKMVAIYENRIGRGYKEFVQKFWGGDCIKMKYIHIDNKIVLDDETIKAFDIKPDSIIKYTLHKGCISICVFKKPDRNLMRY